MIKTSIGLPNTCYVCGKPMTGEWYAAHIDAALSGAGGHKKCLEQKQMQKAEAAAEAVLAELPEPEEAEEEADG